MVKARMLTPKPLFEEALLLESFEEHGVKPLHLKSTLSHMLKSKDATVSTVPDLPNVAKEMLPKFFTRTTSTVERVLNSKDGTTTKLIIRLQDGLKVEAVVMKYEKWNKPGEHRGTLCVSSQVGCKMACTFCATGTMGLLGNLWAGEILEQLVHARDHAGVPIRNIVFMGMGEPLNNYDAVLRAIKLMTDRQVFGIAAAHITVSTVGIVPKVRQLASDAPSTRLALSLHAPNQDLRAEIVPAARGFKLPALMGAVDEFMAATGRGVFIEYVMLAGVNDQPEHADQLGELLQGKDMTVNVIPYNSTDVDAAYQAPAPEAVQEFTRRVFEGYGLRCTVRQEMGQDIMGACGQLVVQGGGAAAGAAAGKGGNGHCRDIEDLV